MLSILVFLLVGVLLIVTAIMFYSVGFGVSVAKAVKTLREQGWTVEPPSAEVQAREAMDDGNE